MSIDPAQGPIGLVCVITYLPSPYQVELFNALAASNEFALSVIYLHRRDEQNPIARHWHEPHISHNAIFIGDGAVAQRQATEAVLGASLLVQNYYRHPQAHAWMRLRVASGLPWCFWGERPGFGRYRLLGRVYRAAKLAALRRSRTPIWGIGKWAVDQYTREFGKSRTYHNVPYFSDLSRFCHTTTTPQSSPQLSRRFLFSGALIYRKGVDLLAKSFLEIANDFRTTSLTFLGAGELERDLRCLLAPLREKVQFHGFQPWAELPNRYAQADVLVVPSRHDGWALVVPEGLATGLPVIGTDRTGAALDLIIPGQNGWLAKAGDCRSLRSAMREAAALSESDLARMKACARQSVSAHQLPDGVARFSGAARATIAHFEN